MPKQQRTMRVEQRSQLALIPEFESRSDAELEGETKYKLAAQAVLGARKAQKFEAKAARAHFQRAMAAATPQERQALRRMMDMALAHADRRADDFKVAAERAGAPPISAWQLRGMRLLGLVAPPASAGRVARVRGIALVVALILLVLLIAFGIVSLIAAAAGGESIDLRIFWSFVLLVIAFGVLAFFGRRRQRRAEAARAEQMASRRSPLTRSGPAMCGRYTLAASNPAEVRARFGLAETVQVRRRFNIAPGDEVLAITTDRDGAPRSDALRWGLVPSWSKSPASGLKMINARVETVRERPAYRRAFERLRCLILADGFYEWQRLERPGPVRKQPFWIHRADGAAVRVCRPVVDLARPAG